MTQPVQKCVVRKVLCACSAQGKPCTVTADSSGSPPEGRQDFSLYLSTQAQTKGTFEGTHQAPSLVQAKTTSGSLFPAITELRDVQNERIRKSSQFHTRNEDGNSQKLLKANCSTYLFHILVHDGFDSLYVCGIHHESDGLSLPDLHDTPEHLLVVIAGSQRGNSHHLRRNTKRPYRIARTLPRE